MRSYRQLETIKKIVYVLTVVAIILLIILGIIGIVGASGNTTAILTIIFTYAGIIVGLILSYLVIRCLLDYFILKRKEDVAHLPQYQSLKKEWNGEDNPKEEKAIKELTKKYKGKWDK